MLISDHEYQVLKNKKLHINFETKAAENVNFQHLQVLKCNANYLFDFYSMDSIMHAILFLSSH